MQYSFISAAFLAFAANVVAQTVFFDAIQTPKSGEVVPAGIPYDLVWNPLDVTGTATITLLQGATNTTLQLGDVIASKVNNQDGKYSWTPKDLGFALYGWRITLDSDPVNKLQDSSYFTIKGSESSSTETGTKTTITLAPGPSYTATTTSTTVAPSSTSTVVPTTSETVSSTSSVSSSGAPTTVTTVSRTSSSTSSSATVTPTQTGAAVANAISGSFAIVGGVLLALAL